MNYLFSFLFFVTTAQASPSDEIKETESKLCESTNEYVLAFNYFKEKDFSTVSEKRKFELAEKISSGCTGAANRFKKVFILLKKLGVDHEKSIELAADFSKTSDETTNNFCEILTGSYLQTFFDYDFKSALRIAYEFSKEYTDDPKKAREDFKSLVSFCNLKENNEIPKSVCARFAIEMAKQSKYFPNGVYPSVAELSNKLRGDKKYGLSIKDTLNIITKIIPYGPLAPKNFSSAYDFAISDEGLGLSPKKSLEFAMGLTKKSVSKLPPPLPVEEEDDYYE